MSFASGRPLVDDKFAWFVFDKFYDKLKNEEWKYEPQKTSYMIERQLYDHEDKDEEKEFCLVVKKDIQVKMIMTNHLNQ